MATISKELGASQADATEVEQFILRQGVVLHKVAKGLASLKLTVVLFAMSIFLIFVGTLAQVNRDMWQVIIEYFHSPIVMIHLQVFFPKTWFPNMQSVPGAFPFPGGLSIGVMMFVNLMAAHGLRFRPQAKGLRLYAGIAVIAFGVLLTWAVIASGHNGEGLQGDPPVSYPVMWTMVKAGVVVIGLGLALAFGTFIVNDRGTWIERGSLIGGSIVAFVLFFAVPYLGASGMRILWQLIQASAPALLLLAGCMMVFKKRGAIVVVHSGIALMMLGELLVGTYVTEERMVIDEGDTVDYAVDIRSTELAIIDSSDKEVDDVVVIPMWVKGRESKFLKSGSQISHEGLPFDLEIVDYYKNSSLLDVKPGKKNKANKGKGLETIAVEAKQGSGADSSGEVDMGSAYIRFLEKGSSKEIGTYMVSQIVLTGRSGTIFSFDDVIPAGDKQYKAELRFKRSYKDYSMRLVDVRKDDYIGTNTPRNYSSDLQLVDASRSENRDIKIWMNNPLRYAGETFYQSGYHQDERTGAETTTLQVVRNTGWMIPYVSCVIVGIGLLAHFPAIMFRFLRRIGRSSETASTGADAAARVTELVSRTQPAEEPKNPKKRAVSKRKRQAPEPVVQPAAPLQHTSDGPSDFTTAVVAAVIVLIFAGWLASKARPQKAKPGEMDLVAFARLPVAFEGRIKPLDTLARNSLRVLSTKERLYVTDKDKAPAIKWLADVISGGKEAEKHRVFRIDSLDVLATLKLTRRKGHLYSYNEIDPQMDEFRKQVKLAQSVDPADMSVFQKKTLELDSRLQLFFKIREAFRLPKDRFTPDEEASYLVGMASNGQNLAMQPVPYCIPTDGTGSQAWEPLTTAVTRLWAKDLAEKHQVSSLRELALKMGGQLFSKETIEGLVEAQLLEMIKEFQPGMSSKELLSTLDRMPADTRAKISAGIREDLKGRKQQFETQLAVTLGTALGDKGLDEAEDPIARSMWNLLNAYRHDEVEEFNTEVKSYADQIVAASPEGLEVGKTKFEASFNHFAPFYNCAALYVFAFLLTMFGWMAWAFSWNRPFHFSAFSLIALVFVVHTIALIGRIYISGRPPVTNLYSSAIFIGWAAVLAGLAMEALFRLGIGNIIASVSGFSTLVIAHQLAGDGDTFTVLQAVLDTQFWLATHVVTVTLGYAATFVAGLLGIVFVLAGIFTPLLSHRVGNYTAGKLLANMIYGTICFALFFSFVGTVLGGLWADDSWGRFWGWDPKENGALIIVLWNALVLHARWDGMIRERGLALLAIGGNVVTSWSWFGVNELGVGLHSYGFTEGVLFWLFLFASSQGALILFGSLPKSMWWSYNEESRTASQVAIPAQ